MNWSPTTPDELQAILAEQLPLCTEEQRLVWERCRVTPRQVELVRDGVAELVFVVAECGEQAIYWEDVEEGFNISPLGSRGELLEH